MILPLHFLQFLHHVSTSILHSILHSIRCTRPTYHSQSDNELFFKLTKTKNSILCVDENDKAEVLLQSLKSTTTL